MFDVAFSELLLIMLVALIVIGPKQLPRVARTAGLLIGKAQRQVNMLKTDIERELRVQELQRLNTEIHQNFDDIESEIKAQALEVRRQFNVGNGNPVTETRSAGKAG